VDELLNRIPSHDVVAVVLFVLLFAAFLVVWVPLQWRIHRRTEMENALKRDMIERGMSAQDIERVIRATAEGTDEEADDEEGKSSSRAGRHSESGISRRN
jgi:hypothetical protein